MLTTTLELSDELQSRAQAQADLQGISVNVFMIRAIELATRNAEMRADFIADALAARQHVEETGIAYAAEDVNKYILAKVRGEEPPEPQPINLFKQN